MKSPFPSTDYFGNALSVGDRVKFEAAPEKLLSGLPPEDQENIKQQAGKAMEIIGFDEYGHAEMMWRDGDTRFTTIWVEPQYLIKVSP